jgi:hypothetical protein
MRAQRVASPTSRFRSIAHRLKEETPTNHASVEPGPPHEAALALWDYAARSAAWAINHSTGDPLAEQIHATLARTPDGLTRTQLRDLLHRNLPAQRVEQALHTLASTGKATRHQTRTTDRHPTNRGLAAATQPTPCFGGTERACERGRPPATDGRRNGHGRGQTRTHAQDFRRYVVRSLPATSSPSSVTPPSPSWLSVNNRENFRLGGRERACSGCWR